MKKRTYKVLVNETLATREIDRVWAENIKSLDEANQIKVAAINEGMWNAFVMEE